jgi:hypothetical protein
MIQAPQIDGIEIDPTDWANTQQYSVAGDVSGG